jgi:hypothetical protein
LGSINSSGTMPRNFLLGLALGGEGFVEYSVNERVFKLGVLGLLNVPPLESPLTFVPFSILSSVIISSN